MRTAASGAAFAALLQISNSVLVTDGSFCGVQCGNVADATTASDITCDQSAYAVSPAGAVFEKCIRCETASNYTAHGQTDLQWMLYNIRFATSYCLFGEPHNPDIGDSPCRTSHACGLLKDAIQWNNLTIEAGPYDFCQSWFRDQVEGCNECLAAGNQEYLGNFVTMMDAACLQKPAPGDRISIEGDPFSTTKVNVTTPSPTPQYTFTPDNSPLNLGARVGIAIGGIMFLLVLAGSCIVWNGKRKRRAFLRELETRNHHQGWPHPKTPHSGSGPDMFETPLSQKPLRGWGDSPVSAATETPDIAFPRYFSPYSSTYNSPVSAADGPSTMNWPTLNPQKLDEALVPDPALQNVQQQEQQQQSQHPLRSQPTAFTHWPTSTQEKLMQMQHEREQQAAADIGIGIALGGDEASLRSKDSNPQFAANPAAGGAAPAAGHGQDPYEAMSTATAPAAAKGKDRRYYDEAYEMYEVDGERRASPVAVAAAAAAATAGDRLASNNPYRGVPAEPAPRAPVLQHPGYGRRPSIRRPGTAGSVGSVRYGGLTEEDARRGHAL